jgi:hypothetical protein
MKVLKAQALKNINVVLGFFFCWDDSVGISLGAIFICILVDAAALAHCIMGGYQC